MPFMDKKEVLFMFSQIKKYVNKSQYEFYFTGGEPTIYPGFKDLLDDIWEMYEGKCGFQIQSNTTRPLEWYEDLLDRQYKEKIHISSSYQNHQVKDKEGWFKNIEFLHKHGILDNIDFMLEEEGFDEIIQAFKRLDGNGYTIQMNFVNYKRTLADKYAEIFKEDENLGEDYLLKYSDGTEEIVPHTMVRTSTKNNFKMMKCDAGYRNIVVETNGDVSICYTHIKSATLPRINLYKDPEKLTKLTSRPQICLWSTCDCEIWLDKWR